MAIIISKNGKGAKKVEKMPFVNEKYLEEYIMNNPESIPLYHIKEDIRLLVLARQVHTAHGPIDAFGVDKEGKIYLIETKLYKNPDKRSIVAQVLDYGASLWRTYGDFTEFMRDLDGKVQEKFKKNTAEKIKEFFKIEEEDADLLLENIQQNLSKGNYRFVVLLDKVDDKLKDLILFINENSRFDIFAVEFEYYKHEEYEIMIPKLYGAEVKKDVMGGNRPPKQNDAFFRQKVKEVEDQELSKLILDLHEFSLTEMIEIDYGTSQKMGIAYFKIKHPNSKSGFTTILRLKSDGHFKIGFWAILNEIPGGEGKQLSKKLLDKLSILPAIREWYVRTDKKLREEKIEEHINFPGKNMAFREAFPDQKSLELFKTAILDFIKEIKK